MKALRDIATKQLLIWWDDGYEGSLNIEPGVGQELVEVDDVDMVQFNEQAEATVGNGDLFLLDDMTDAFSIDTITNVPTKSMKLRDHVLVCDEKQEKPPTTEEDTLQGIIAYLLKVGKKKTDPITVGDMMTALDSLVNEKKVVL